MLGTLGRIIEKCHAGPVGKIVVALNGGFNAPTLVPFI